MSSLKFYASAAEFRLKCFHTLQVIISKDGTSEVAIVNSEIWNFMSP